MFFDFNMYKVEFLWCVWIGTSNFELFCLVIFWIGVRILEDQHIVVSIERVENHRMGNFSLTLMTV